LLISTVNRFSGWIAVAAGPPGGLQASGLARLLQDKIEIAAALAAMRVLNEMRVH
jgi:hypothetical protein